MSAGISTKSIPYMIKSITGCMYVIRPVCKYASPAHTKCGICRICVTNRNPTAAVNLV